MKFLVSPLLWLFILLVGVTLGVLWAGFRGKRTLWKTGSLLALLPIGALYLLSISFGPEILHRTLTHRLPSAPESTPRYIVVLSGGYIRGLTSNLDVLSSASAHRMRYAVDWLDESPDAILVLTGTGDGLDGRSSSHMTDLMASYANSLGVPKERIIQETEAINTWEHPIKLLSLDDIDSTTPVGIVTSDWHLFRTLAVFTPHFDELTWRGATMVPRPLPLWRRLIPNEECLLDSTRYLHEWFGHAWYRLRG